MISKCKIQSCQSLLIDSFQSEVKRASTHSGACPRKGKLAVLGASGRSPFSFVRSCPTFFFRCVFGWEWWFRFGGGRLGRGRNPNTQRGMWLGFVRHRGRTPYFRGCAGGRAGGSEGGGEFDGFQLPLISPNGMSPYTMPKLPLDHFLVSGSGFGMR